MRIAVLLITTVAAAAIVLAQSDETPLRNAMKQIGPLNGGVGKKIAAKDNSAVADAEKIKSLFGDVKKFWESRSAHDAVEFATSAGAGFGEVSKLASAGQWDEAAAAQKKIGANCMGCHSAHREKAEDGSFKIK